MSSSARGRRARALEQLQSTHFDLLVIGGGIIGSRVAYDAARAGLTVALVDAGDFGGATSSASAKLIHGGLRYLRMRKWRLVHSALKERYALATTVAPHLVRRLPFLFLIERKAPYSRLMVTLGLFLYRALSGFREPAARVITVDKARALVPALRSDALTSCLLFHEAQTHDSRLTLATVTAAARAGSVVANYVRVTEIHQADGRVTGATLACRNGEGGFSLRARAVVNATGPWVDSVRRLEDPRCAPLVRLSKGIHVLLPLPEGWRAAVTVSLDETNVLFAIPWQDMLMLGTTDTPYDGDPAAVAPEREDVDALLRGAEHFLSPELREAGDVRFAFAGLRALPLGRIETARASREHIVTIGPGGMVSVAGGKLTTHRKIALDVLRRLPSEVRPRWLLLGRDPLPGSGRGEGATRLRERVDTVVLSHLTGLYGSEADRLLVYDGEDRAWERIHPDGPDIWAQAYNAVDEEWALTVDDVVRRRTTLAVRGLATDAVRDEVAAALAD